MSEIQSEVSIKTLENGPYLVAGPARVLDPDGRQWETKGRATFALCRCGGSRSKPFCDGTHNKIGFAASERAASAS